MGKKGIALERIVELLNEGKTLVEIGEILGCSTSNVGKRLKKEGVPFKRDYSKSRYKRTNRHTLNEYYFDFIDTEDKAYFLGLLYSDGSMEENQFYIKLTDLDVLQRLKEVLNTSVPIRTVYHENKNWKTTYVLTISSKYMCRKLSELGCIKNKSRAIRLPNIKEELIRHFIRGFFDGDGCLYLHDKIYHCVLDIASASKQFLEDIRPIMALNGKTNGYLGKEKNHEVWHLHFGGHQVFSILEWLYKDATIYMQRKYNKYKLLSPS